MTRNALMVCLVAALCGSPACSDDTTAPADATVDTASGADQFPDAPVIRDGKPADGDPADGDPVDAPAADSTPPGDSTVGPPDAPTTDAALKKACAKLAADYLIALAAAKKCSPMLPVVQCTLLVDDKLPCPCKTWVEKGNTAAVAQLNALKAQWTAFNCHKGIACPAIPCPSPGKGQCTNSGCVDKKP